MQISCPECFTRYTLPDRAIPGSGRKVKCKQCTHVWMQYPVSADDDFDDPMEKTALFGGDDPTEVRPMPSIPSAPPAFDDRDDGVKPRRRLPYGWMALAASIIAVVAGIGAAREPLVHVWPPANLLFETVGMPVLPPGAGLVLQNPRSEQRQENGATVLVVEGQIVNNSNREQPVPRVRAIAMDSHQQSIQTWVIDASAASLQPGEIATFFSTQKDPGPVAMLKLTFEIAGLAGTM